MNVMLKIKKSSLGFTLIELLVVITILAILAVVGFVSFSGIQANARDSRRREDIDAIAKALETQRVVNGSITYPGVTITSFANGSIPVDPRLSQSYNIATVTVGNVAPTKPTTWTANTASPTVPAGYTPIASSFGLGATGWTVCALLESGTNPNVYCRSHAQ